MTATVCPRCGQPLSSDAPAGLCASCLMAASAETMASGSLDDLATMTSVGSRTNQSSDVPALQPDTVWGPYRLGRLLGRGGMGEVYEAEHLLSGRRLALKVLRNRLQSRDERARFLREGQLAASISHPHTVYIFGSEEIDGTPVISMELLTGGTLKDRVTAHGPMSPDEAVAAVLDLIGGLDAAAAAGILHRDIKPSNCFIDRDGVVKVGDFGLSISTLARDVHQELVTSGFEGTPQFAPPEQLRGEPLDVRADIYAVGATLYYLLTGRAPFDAPDLRQLFDKVTTETPASPRQLRRDIPARLSTVVMQCLAKAPANRPASYPALAESLRPFLARDDKPAALGTRLLAGALDSWIIVGVPVAVAVALLADPLSGSPQRTAALSNWSWLVAFVYFLIVEGASGASVGKRLLGLRVVSADGAGASWPQIVVRTAVFYSASMLTGAAVLSGILADSQTTAPPNGWYIDVPRTLPVVLWALMFFSTARRGNGWTGLHDVISRTRVVSRPPAIERQARTSQQSPAAFPAGSARRYGPFIAVDSGDRVPGTVVRAFDPVLRRQVWIDVADDSAPPISDARRDLARPGRLHWLAGRRSPEENWDAYEAPDGAAWTTAVAGREWSQTRLQLLDLANELARATADGTRPPLALDRVWMRDNGRIVLLDSPPPDAPVRTTADLTPEQLLQAMAIRVPRDSTGPDGMPLSARAFLERWSAPETRERAPGRRIEGLAPSERRPDSRVEGSLPSLLEGRASLQAMAAAPTQVHWWRRALPGVIAASPVAVMLLVAVAIVPGLQRFQTSETSGMMNLLGVLRSTTLPADNPMRRPEVREAAEVAVAGRYGHMIRDQEFWEAGVVRALAPDYRPLAEEILAQHPNVSAGELATAEDVLKKAREERVDRRGRRQQSTGTIGGIIISTVTALAMALVLAACVISSLLVPGGLVSRQLGLATVTRSGKEITRARSALRAIVAGLPAIVWLTYLAFMPRVQGFVPTPPRPITAVLVTVGVLGLGLAWTIARRTRGPHDILLGTWVVPR